MHQTTERETPSGAARSAHLGVLSRMWERAPGLALAVVIAIIGTVIGHAVPVVGGPVSGILIGLVLAILIKPGERLKPGIGTASKFVLQLSVVVLGTQLSIGQVVEVGISSLPVMIGTLAVCLASAYFVGRRLRTDGDLRTLIGVGTGICGASAIAAVTPVIGAVGTDVAYAVSTIFLFNIAAVLTFPLIGHLLGMSQHAFGLFAGTAVNDMSSVVAASSTYGSTAANYAVVVKLTRTLLIIPICLGLAALTGRADKAAGAAHGSAEVVETAAAASQPKARQKVRIHRLVPWFLIGFLVVVAVNSAGLIPHGAHSVLNETSMFMITIAMSAIGLSTDLVGLRRTGPRPLILGAALWVIVSVTSLGLQYAISFV